MNLSKPKFPNNCLRDLDIFKRKASSRGKNFQYKNNQKMHILEDSDAKIQHIDTYWFLVGLVIKY